VCSSALSTLTAKSQTEPPHPLLGMMNPTAMIFAASLGVEASSAHDVHAPELFRPGAHELFAIFFRCPYKQHSAEYNSDNQYNDDCNENFDCVIIFFIFHFLFFCKHIFPV
jgi:hypothetical protein